ncbi:MAG: hypothetical protein H6558_16550 [Lewinellaceae bacterium]|nr:hypothetical protein [Lewinellaceae bacterium]MCB9290311.1 hypothetical protein [Lewinellaceae bacterium]
MTNIIGESYLRKGKRRGGFYIKNVPAVEYEPTLRAAQNCPSKTLKVKVL